MPEMQTNQSHPTPPPYYYMKPKKSRWWVPVVITLAVIVSIIVFIFGMIGMAGSALTQPEYVMKSNSVLYLNYGSSLEEVKGPGESLFGTTNISSFSEVLTAIKKAKNDDNIEGLYFRANSSQMGFAKAMEIHQAIQDFKKSGKFVYAFIETATEMDYFNALPADKIFIQPEGIVEMNGFSISSLFMKGLYNKLGIEFLVVGFEDFKSAGESYSRKNFSDSSRYQLKKLLDQRHDTFVNAIAKYRSMDKENINAILNRGIYTADSMLTLGFVDEYASEMTVKEKMKELVFADDDKEMNLDNKMRLVTPTKYLASSTTTVKEIQNTKDQIAIVYASGAIKMGKKNSSPFSSESGIYADNYVKILKKVRENDRIKAVILRIDSPGGSVIASDEIYEEIQKIKAVKPIYASMSDVAASGGYYMSMGCDTIVCHQNTITGSIGVISVIPNLSGLMEKLDITADTISTANDAQFMNVMYPLQNKDKEKFKKLSRTFYDKFLNKVAKSRNKTYDEVRAVAKGRVWTGEKAKEHGLVDVIGGLDKAIEIAKHRIGIPKNTKAKIRTYPRTPNKIEALFELFGLNEQDQDDASYVNVYSMLAKSLDISIESQLLEAMPEEMKLHLNYTKDLINMSKRESVLMAMPQQIIIK